MGDRRPVWLWLAEPGVLRLGEQNYSWQGFRKQKVKVGCGKGDHVGGRGPLGPAT